ncbi:hypothetical protein ACUXVY_12730 [Chromobacterium haemolyticum]|uniref:hypothetical protein n=1 Tax=Chromobacterium haemolyticum TaxID=394935 RepID=UPI00405729FA
MSDFDLMKIYKSMHSETAMEQKVQLINKIIELCSAADLPNAYHRYDSAKRVLFAMQCARAFPSDVAAYDQAVRAFADAFLGKDAA